MALPLQATTSTRLASSFIRCSPGAFQWEKPSSPARFRHPSKPLSSAAWQRILKTAMPVSPTYSRSLSRHARHVMPPLFPLSLSQQSCLLNLFTRRTRLERTHWGKLEICPHRNLRRVRHSEERIMPHLL